MTRVRLRGVLLLISVLAVAVTMQAMWQDQWRAAFALYAIAVVAMVTMILYRTYRKPESELTVPATAATATPFHPRATSLPIPLVVSNKRRNRN